MDQTDVNLTGLVSEVVGNDHIHLNGHVNGVDHGEESKELVIPNNEETAVAVSVEEPAFCVESATTTLTTACVDYSFGTFFNWFMPSCMDIWNIDDSGTMSPGTASSSESPQTIIAYGARSFLFLLDVTRSTVEAKGRLMMEDVAYSIRYRDLINVLNHTISKKFVDVFRTNNTYITTVVFEKPRDFVGRHKLASTTENIGPRVFVGNSDGLVALYDVQKRKSVLQDLPFNTLKLPCCRKVSQSKILSATWLHFRSIGSVVFYSLDTHLMRWEINGNVVSIQHDNNQDCGQPGRLIGQLQISCLASMSAECTSDRSEHKLAIGYMGGKIVIFGFDPVNGTQKSIIFLSDNSHNDDVCSLSFSPYSIGSISSYRSGLLCSISRDSVLKVWSCGNQSEIAEFRINSQFNRNDSAGPPLPAASAHKSHHHQHQAEGQSKCNWFSAVFLPRSNIVQPTSGTSVPQSSGNGSGSGKGASYELLITAPTGELITITIPDKEPNSKLRIAKASKFSSRGGLRNSTGLSPIDHAHQSVIFSIMINAKLGIAITYSLDYKMLLWDLNSRNSKAVFHLFSNGALSIDSCSKDKRIAVAFGNSIYAMDFGGNFEASSSNHEAVVLTTRCTTAPKTWKFYAVSWNNLSDSERLGALALGNSQGEVLYYDLNERTYLVKPSNRQHHQKNGDLTKIYKFVWPVKFPVGGGSADLRTVVLSLHASFSILVNYLPARNCPNKPAENFMTSKFVANLPPEGQLRKHTAVDEFDRGRILVIGNDDGTVDLLVAQSEVTTPGQLYRHLFRFRAFTKPIISIEASNGEKDMWLAVTAMHDNFAHCYHLNEDLLSLSSSTEDISINGDNPSSMTDFVVRQITDKFKLVGHQDRVAASCWSPFIEGCPEGSSISAPLLVTASYDTTCIVWNVPNQQPLKRFYGHRSLIYTIKWSHFDPELIFTGGEDCFHCWNWTKQPDYCGKIGQLLGKSLVNVDSLKRSAKKAVELGEKCEVKVDSATPEISSKSSKPSSASITSTLSVSIPTAPVKALFSLSNQIENNSSKYDILDDIKWIHKMKQFYLNSPTSELTPEIVSERKLSRILLYGSRVEVMKFLKAEEENHRKNSQMDSADMVCLFGDILAAIKKAVDQGEADLVMASYVMTYSRELYRDCVKCYWNQAAGNTRIQLSKAQRLIASYGKEMRALSQLYSLMDFGGAIDGLVDNSMHREAIVLAKINHASDLFVDDLWMKWHQTRLASGNYEGAIKCLVACGKVAEAIQLLEQRRTLCADTSANTVMKQYQEVIELLKGGVSTPVSNE